MIYRVIGSYNRALNAYPLLTQCTTTGKFDLDFSQFFPTLIQTLVFSF
jgi:hypothetical protein